MCRQNRTVGVVCATLAATMMPTLAKATVPQARLADGYGALPLSFEANLGQAPAAAKYLARGDGYALYLTPTQAVLVLRGPTGVDGNVQTLPHERRDVPPPTATSVVRMRLVAADTAAVLSGENVLPGKINYLTGGDAERWVKGAATFERVRCTKVYPGIDLVYYGKQRRLEYDFVVAPHADPGVILLEFDGVKQLEIDGTGNLVLHTAVGQIVQHAPVVYQRVENEQRKVDGLYVLQGDGHVGFELGDYDPAHELVIDPALSYSHVLAGVRQDFAFAIDVDSQGAAYITGYTFSHDFPTTDGALDVYFGPEPLNGQVGSVSADDAFVTKISPDGSTIVYSTYLGGTRADYGWDIVVDQEGNAYVVGETYSDDFPTTAGAFQTPPLVGASATTGEGFVSKLDPTGSALVYSTYLGDADVERHEGDVGTVTGYDGAYGITIDAQRNAYVTGETYSPLFPTTAGAYDRELGTEGSQGQVGDVGNTGDAFVSKLDPNGTMLIYSTYLGGRINDFGHGIAVDDGANVYVTGQTKSDNFPTTSGAFQTPPFVSAVPGTASALGTAGALGDAYVTKLNPDGSDLVYSTYLGDGDVERSPDPHVGSTTGAEFGTGIAVDEYGAVYVTGATSSQNFPTTAGAFDRTLDTPGPEGQAGDISSTDAFVTKVKVDGSNVVWSTYLGGDGAEYGNDLDLDLYGHVYVTGSTSAHDDFPETANDVPKQLYYNAQITDGFVTKMYLDGSGVTWSVRFGGENVDDSQGIALGPNGNVFTAGYTYSQFFLDDAQPDYQYGAGLEPDAYVAMWEDPELQQPYPCPGAGFGMILFALLGLWYTRPRRGNGSNQRQ